MNLGAAPTIADLPPVDPSRTGWPWSAGTGAPADLGVFQWPRITVVTPSYQQGAFLEECVRSVLLQGYPNLDFVVIDGGSTDGSVELISRYSSFLSFWQSKRDGGQGDAINQGFARATGEVFGWINSDDLLLPGALFAVARAFVATGCDLVYGDAINAFEDDHSVQYWQGYWLADSFLKFGGVISSHAAFWRKRIHEPIWTDLNCAIDWELWQRLVPGRRVRYLAQPLGVCRIHDETKSRNPRWIEKWREDEERVSLRHGRPSSNRLYRFWFSRSQRVFKWFSWRSNRGAKRAVMEACGWPERPWRGPHP